MPRHLDLDLDLDLDLTSDLKSGLSSTLVRIWSLSSMPEPHCAVRQNRQKKVRSRHPAHIRTAFSHMPFSYKVSVLQDDGTGIMQEQCQYDTASENHLNHPYPYYSTTKG